MTLAWTPEMKERAKAEKKALVKLQVQLKHCNGGNYEITGPFDRDHALALFLLGTLRHDDTETIQAVLTTLQAEKV